MIVAGGALARGRRCTAGGRSRLPTWSARNGGSIVLMPQHDDSRDRRRVRPASAPGERSTGCDQAQRADAYLTHIERSPGAHVGGSHDHSARVGSRPAHADEMNRPTEVDACSPHAAAPRAVSVPRSPSSPCSRAPGAPGRRRRRTDDLDAVPVDRDPTRIDRQARRLGQRQRHRVGRPRRRRHFPTVGRRRCAAAASWSTR